MNIIKGAINKEKIHIVGLGVAEKAALSAPAQSIINAADIIIGSERQLLTIGHLLGGENGRNKPAKTISLPPLSELNTLVNSHKSKLVVVLASGDPLYYGIGRWFVRNFKADNLYFYPAVSSIQAACHELGLSLQDVDVISLHGRPLEKIRTKLHRNKKLVVLTDRYSQPQVLAKKCIAAGFEQSTITVCENLGYKQQRISSFGVTELIDMPDVLFDPLHISVIEIAGSGGVLPEFPGISDANYITGEVTGKGMISKREVRLVILSLLQPSAQDIIWDIGAGCGGVSVELAYWNETARIYAIEHHKERLNYLLKNCQRFGVTHNVNIIDGRAPQALEGLPLPTKVLIGGSDGELATLLSRVWELLPIDGVLVASAVINSTKKMLTQFVEVTGNAEVESVEVSVKRGTLQAVDDVKCPDKPQLVYEQRLPVEIFRLKKLME